MFEGNYPLNLLGVVYLPVFSSSVVCDGEAGRLTHLVYFKKLKHTLETRGL